MTFLWLILSTLLSFSVMAEDIVYTDATFKPTPIEYAHKMNQFFKEEGFVVLANDQHGIPSLGVNQVYFKDEGVFVMVKYGIEGEFALNQIVQTPENAFLVHDQVGNNKYFLYFQGMNEHAVKFMLTTMKEKVASYKAPSFSSYLIPEAHASMDCGAPQVVEQMTDFQHLSGKMVWDFAKNCVTGLGQGAWSSTGGAVADTLSNVWSAVRHPIDTADRIGKSVYNFTVGIAKFVKGIVTDPRGTMMSIGRGVGEVWNSLVDTVTNMSTSMKIQFICSFIGSMGVDAAIAMFTSGGGAARFAIKLAAMAKKFSMIAKTMALLSKLSGSAKAALGLSTAKIKNLMNRLMNNSLPDADLIHLEKMGDKDLSLRTLACYI
jgi:hypothetical protein